MADNEVKEAEASMANLLLDEVTGEKVSKTELKKRQKQREKDAKKKEKEAAAPPKTQKKASAEEEEANLSPNVSIPGFGFCVAVVVFRRRRQGLTSVMIYSNISKSEARESTSSVRPSNPTPTLTSSRSPMTCASSSRITRVSRRARRSLMLPFALLVEFTPSVARVPS